MKKIKVNFINNHHHQITKEEELFHKHQIHRARPNQSYYQIRVYISRQLAFVLHEVLLDVFQASLILYQILMAQILLLLGGVRTFPQVYLHRHLALVPQFQDIPATTPLTISQAAAPHLLGHHQAVPSQSTLPLHHRS